MMPRPDFRQQGFTLIELLIALAIGAMLMSAVAATVSAISRAQSLTRDYENIQETLRFTTAVMTRSLRSAQEINDLTGTEITLSRGGSAQSCLGTSPGGTWTERYFLQGGNLRCQVNGNNSEILAFGVSAMQLHCVEYGDTMDGVSDFSNLSCASATADQVVALRVHLTLDAAQLNQINTNFEHRFTVTLRNRLESLRNE